MAVIAPLLMSVAVKVVEPAVFGVTERVLVPATSAALAGQRRVGVGGGDADGVGGGDQVPVGVDRVDGDVEAATCGLRGRRAGLAGCGAGCGGLAGQQDLELAKAPALIVVAGLVFAVIAPL